MKYSLDELQELFKFLDKDCKSAYIKISKTNLGDLLIEYEDHGEQTVTVQLTSSDSPYTSKLTRTDDLSRFTKQK